MAKPGEHPANILYFSNTAAFGGAEAHVLGLLRNIGRQRFRLHWACHPKVAEYVSDKAPSDVEILPLVYTPGRPVGSIALARILRERKISILHSHLFYASMVASPVGWACGVPVVIETTHLREVWRQGWKAWSGFDRLADLFIDRYVAVSYANGKYLAEDKGLPSRKITVIQNGIDVSRVSNLEETSSARRRLGIAEGDPVLVVLARLEAQKGHTVLLDAMPDIVSEFPNAKLYCVGDGSLRSELEAQSARLKLEPNVRFVGHHSDVLPWLAAADISVLPSFFEGLPLVAIESLAAGKPMVATAVDGTPEVVIDGVTGLTVPPGDPRALGQAIRRVLRDEELRKTLASNGRECAMTKFTEERQARQTEELYIRCLDRGSAAVPSRERPSAATASRQHAPGEPKL